MSAFKAITLLQTAMVLASPEEEFCRPMERLPYPGDAALTAELRKAPGGPRSNIPFPGALGASSEGGCTANYNWESHHLKEDDSNYSKKLATKWAYNVYTKQRKLQFWANKLTPVKDQAQCASCWAHGAVESLESAIANAYGGAPVPLSVQQVISEVGAFNGGGCKGGAYPMMALRYAKEAGKILSEKSDPYLRSCKQNDYTKMKDKDFINTHIESVEQLTYAKKSQAQRVFMQALDYGHTPVVIINCACLQHNYQKGSLLRVHQMSAQDLDFRPESMKFWGNNHAVQLVGYNTEHTTPYWILRNSWGSWNAEYVFVEMGNEEDTDDVLGHVHGNLTVNTWMNNAFFPKMGSKPTCSKYAGDDCTTSADCCNEFGDYLYCMSTVAWPNRTLCSTGPPPAGVALSEGSVAGVQTQQNGTLLSANRLSNRRQATRESAHGARSARHRSHRSTTRHSSHARGSRRSNRARHSSRHAQRARSHRRQSRRSERH